MTDQWKWNPTKPGPQMAGVLVWPGQGGCVVIENACGDHSTLPANYLHPLPPSLSPEQEAVIEAAGKWREIHGYIGASNTCSALTAAIDALHASLAPRDRHQELLDAAKEVVGLSPQHARLRAAIAALSERGT